MRAQVYTGANALVASADVSGSLLPNIDDYDVPYTVGGSYYSGNLKINPVGSWDSNGMGYSSNVIVTSSIDTINKGNVFTIPGQLIANFHYDFDQPAVSAPSFNTLDVNTIQSNVLIPNTWSWTRDFFDNVTGITANTYVTANASTYLGNILGWTKQAGTGSYGNGAIYTQWYYSVSNISQNLGLPVPLTANVFPIDTPFSYPGEFEVTQDQIDNDGTFGVVSTSHCYVNLSTLQQGPQTNSHVFIPNYLTQITGNGNIKYGLKQLPGPDDGHLDSTGFNNYYYGAFDGNANVPTPITGNLQSNAAIGTFFGAWVEGTLSS